MDPKHFKMTMLDRVAYDNPQEEIIDKGGHIFIVKMNELLVGSVSLERGTDKQYVLDVWVYERATIKMIKNITK